MNRIEIKKDIIPYRFDIDIGNKIFTFDINYNFLFDYFTIDLSFADEVLVKGEKLVLEEVLFKSLYKDDAGNIDERFPSDVLIPISPNNAARRIGWNELENSVFLFVATKEELGIE